jgi:hypothetical protein
LVYIERADAGTADYLRRGRWHRERPIDWYNVGGVLVIRHEVLRTAHNDVRLAVDLLSGEMCSAEFVRS